MAQFTFRFKSGVHRTYDAPEHGSVKLQSMLNMAVRQGSPFVEVNLVGSGKAVLVNANNVEFIDPA